jgi:hypothetical protein
MTTVYAVPEQEDAGSVVYWRLQGAVDPDHLAAVWEQAGLDPADLPELPSSATALNRTLKAFQRGRTLIRPLAAGGYAVVQETARREALEYDTVLTARLDSVGRLVFSREAQATCDCGWAEKSDEERATSLHTKACAVRVAVEAAGEAHPLAPAIRTAYATTMNELAPVDVVPWLVDLLYRRCDAVALRDHGGVYYVPRTGTERWRAILGAIREVSQHRIFEIPALSSKEVLSAVLDAVEREAAREAEDMAAELASGVSERVAKTRVARCDAVEQKVTRYEAILGERLEGIRAKLAELRGGLASAMLSNEAAEQAAAE